MSNQTPTLKSFGDLTALDFSQHPVWAACHCLDTDEPWYEETTEETFRPWNSYPANPEDGMFLVMARMTLSNGLVLDGFLTPQHEREPLSLGTIQPYIFLATGKQIAFWHGICKPPLEETSVFYSELGLTPSEAFPIFFAAVTGLAVGRVTGEIPGFQYLESDSVRTYT